jgi:hypothetical protein
MKCLLLLLPSITLHGVCVKSPSIHTIRDCRRLSNSTNDTYPISQSYLPIFTDFSLGRYYGSKLSCFRYI